MLTKFLCKHPAGCQCLFPRPGRQGGLSLMCVIHQSKITCVPKKGQHADKLQHAANCLLAEEKKYSTLFSSPPRGRCLIQHIKTEKSNYSGGTGETQLQRGTALAPAGGCGVAKPCHIPAGSARGLCRGGCPAAPAKRAPPMLHQGDGTGSSPEATLRCTRAPGATRERRCLRRGACLGQILLFLRVRGLDNIF